MLLQQLLTTDSAWHQTDHELSSAVWRYKDFDYFQTGLLGVRRGWTGSQTVLTVGQCKHQRLQDGDSGNYHPDI